MNTATVSATGNADQTATAVVSFSEENVIGDDFVDLELRKSRREIFVRKGTPGIGYCDQEAFAEGAEGGESTAREERGITCLQKRGVA